MPCNRVTFAVFAVSEAALLKVKSMTCCSNIVLSDFVHIEIFSLRIGACFHIGGGRKFYYNSYLYIY
jgi:hypothetical protein